MPDDAEMPGQAEIVAAPMGAEEWLPVSTVPAWRLTLLGIQGSGKTYLVKEKLIPLFAPYYLVIDPNNEYEGFNRYIPKFGSDPEFYKKEIELLVRKVIMPSCDTIEEQKARGKRKVKALRLLVVEEADLLAPSQKNMNPGMRHLVVVSRHLDLNIIFLSRRPTDLATYIMDTSDFIVTFKQTGNNAKKVLKNMSDGADKEIGKISFENHEFLYFTRDREYTQPSPDDLCDILSKEAGLTPPA